MSHSLSISNYLSYFKPAINGYSEVYKKDTLLTLIKEMNDHYTVWYKYRKTEEDDYSVGLKFIEWACTSKLRLYPHFGYETEVFTRGMLALLAVLMAFKLKKPDAERVQQNLSIYIETFANGRLEDLATLYLPLSCCIEYFHPVTK